MLKKSTDELNAIIAVGLGANKGFWMIQPRDDGGQWIEMGASVLFRFRTGDGNLVVATGKGVYVGPAGRPGVARVMIKDPDETGLDSGVYEIDSRNLQQFKAILPDSDKDSGAPSARKDKFGKPVKTLEDSKLPDVQALLKTRKDITSEDERLGRGELSPEERKAEQDARNESPIANLPAGFEAENPEEVKNLLRKAGVDVDSIGASEDAPERGEKPKAYGIRNWNEFRDLPDDTVLDQYERAQYYPSPDDYRGANGPVSRQIVKKDGKWYLLGKSGKPVGKPYDRRTINELLNGGTLTDSGAGSRIDENGNKVPAWADEAGAPEGGPNEGVMPFGRSSLKDKPKEMIFAQNLYLDAYEGKIQNIDNAIDDSLALSRNLENSKKKDVFDLRPGDRFVDSDAREYTVLENKTSPLNNLNRILVLQDSDGSTSSRDVPGFDEVDLLPETDRPAVKRPERPAAPEARPADTPESTPEPSTPDVVDPTVPDEADDSDGLDPNELVTATNEGLAPPNFPPKDRMDDGSEFELPTLTNEELEAARRTKLTPIPGPDGSPARYVDEYNRLVEAEDPFAMMDALAKIYPNAKFTEDGSLILHRQKDKDGRIFELRANNSGKKAINYTMRWTDPETGEYKEYQHKDDRHSIKALLSKANGPQGLLDRLLGRVDNDGKDWGDPKNYYFGNQKFKREDSLFARSKWFRSGTGDRKKMEEISQRALRMAEGNQAIYHDDERMILKHQEIPSLWDSFVEWFSSGPNREERDAALREDLFHVLYGVFGNIPLNERAHAAARKAIRDEFKRRFPNASTRESQSFNGIVTSASERMRGIYRTPDAETRSIRYSSKDRTRAIEVGQTVEYTNNVGEKSTLKVTALVENLGVTPNNASSYDYGDYVQVIDANGNKRVINALKLRIFDNQELPLTAYIANLRGEALARKRREMEGIPDPSGGQSLMRPGIDWDAIAPPVGTRTVVSDPPSPPMLIDDFISGDMLYDKSGRPLGIIKTPPRPTKSRDGSEGLAFLYTKPDGTEGTAVYKLGTEITPKKA
jgi:hypothetical protein